MRNIYTKQHNGIAIGTLDYLYIKKSNTPFSYMLFKKLYRELNLESFKLDEDTGPGYFSFLSSSSPLGQTAVSGNYTLH